MADAQLTAEMQEFIIPKHVGDLEYSDSSNQYVVDAQDEFNVPQRQQLDDLTRLFDALQREKSPAAIFTKPELFTALYTYIKALEQPGVVCKEARHKICHETGERLKKLLLVTIGYIKKNQQNLSDSLLLCLRSAIRMYAWVLCHVLLSPLVAADADLDEAAESTQHSQGSRRRRRRCFTGAGELGIGDDASGVDQDGRELALTCLFEVCGPEIHAIWKGPQMDEATLNLVLKTTVHMMTQKANTAGEAAQSVSAALGVLVTRILQLYSAAFMEGEKEATEKGLSNRAPDPREHVIAPVLELILKYEATANFFSRCVSDLENEDPQGTWSRLAIEAVFERLFYFTQGDFSGDGTGPKNISLFYSEVSKRNIRLMMSVSHFIVPLLQCENYEIRKATITVMTEVLLQCLNAHIRHDVEDTKRNQYLSVMLHRLLDCNPFMRNHTLHMWERLAAARAVPKVFHLPCVKAIVGRLEDRNYLVRDSALQALTSILQKNWFGQVLSNAPNREKLAECEVVAQQKCRELGIDYTEALTIARQAMEITEERGDASLIDDLPEGEQSASAAIENVGTMTEAAEPTPRTIIPEAALNEINRVLYFENNIEYIGIMQSALKHTERLLESRMERDVIEAMKLVVACCEYRLEGSGTAFLRVLVMVFESEPKIQLAVRDAFVEIIFLAFARMGTSSLTRNVASAQKLISILNGSGAGEMNAINKIFGLIKSNPSTARFLSEPFYEAMFSIADGSLDGASSSAERRTAMQLYSLMANHHPKDVTLRQQSLISFLQNEGSRDNMMLAYGISALERESLSPQFTPISCGVVPTQHPVLNLLVTHLCRPTTHISSWMTLAEAAISAIHHLCQVPVALYNYVLTVLGNTIVGKDVDYNRIAQLFLIVGHTALKQLVAVDCYERSQMKALDEGPSPIGQKPKGQTVTTQSKDDDMQPETDSMHKELGLGSIDFKRHELQQLCMKQRLAIMEPGSMWNRYSTDIIQACKLRSSVTRKYPYFRVCAILALCKLMVANEALCADNVQLLFTIASGRSELWMVKTNIVIALGDLASVHPNTIGPFMRAANSGFFKLLSDSDVRVRAVTIQVCSHLVLGEMLRVRDHLHVIVRMVADPVPEIARNAVVFVKNLALKEKERIGNQIPPLVGVLSNTMPEDKFQLAVRTLIEKVEGDKPMDSLVERLCARFEPYSESKKKRQFARSLAFCLSELNYSTERATKRIMSEGCYQQYKQWLRDEQVLDFFKIVANKARRNVGGRANSLPERRDRATIEEWEARMQQDAASIDGPVGATEPPLAEGVSEDGDQRAHTGADSPDDSLSDAVGAVPEIHAAPENANGEESNSHQRSKRSDKSEIQTKRERSESPSNPSAIVAPKRKRRHNLH